MQRLLPLVLLLTLSVQADEGHPVAVRCWPDGGVSIETMWDLHVAVDVSAENESLLPRLPDICVVSEAASLKSKTHQWKTAGESWMLDRKPNELAITWKPAAEAKSPSRNAVRVSRLEDGVRIDVDGTVIVVGSKAAAQSVAKGVRVDVWVASDDAVPLTGVGFVLTTSAEVPKLARQLTHNTFVVSQFRNTANASVVVELTTTAWEMPDELAGLFARKEKSSAASRKVFEALSVEQLNFKPSNGTHTPRWNTEHMMGRELGFFSQIYAARNDQISIVNLNPMQMPKDYKFAHPDWTGAEEARQTARVSAFTRRYAYLLEGLDLDKKAPGSRFWTPRSLLLQMERHYNSHTANVRDKMKLPDWPKS